MAHTTYDLLVIGSGPAGQKAALSAAKLGRRVALIDRADRVGGDRHDRGRDPDRRPDRDGGQDL